MTRPYPGDHHSVGMPPSRSPRARRGTGTTTGLAILVLGTLALATVLTVTLAVPRTVEGSGTVLGAPTGEHGEDPIIRALPTQPEPLWETSEELALGSPQPATYVIPLAADDRMVIAGASSDLTSAGGVVALDQTNGRALWRNPSMFLASDCALSRDRRLACVASASDRQTEVAFLEAATGAVSATATVRSGRSQIVRAADGFLVTSVLYDSVSYRATTTLTAFESDGRQRWTQVLPEQIGDPALSEAGDVIVVGDSEAGVRVLSLPTGDVLYDSAADDELRGPGGAADDDDAQGSANTWIRVAATGTGFAVSHTVYPRRSLRLFDRQGIEHGLLADLELPNGRPTATEGALLPVQGENKSDRPIAGAVSTVNGKLLWSVEGNIVDDVSLLAGRYVGVQALADVGYRWTFIEAASGVAGATIPMSTHQRYKAFDGTRLIFEGDGEQDEPGPRALVAYDPQSGEQAWRLKETRDADDVDVQIVGPYLFVLETRSGRSSPTMTRMG